MALSLFPGAPFPGCAKMAFIGRPMINAPPIIPEPREALAKIWQNPVPASIPPPHGGRGVKPFITTG